MAHTAKTKKILKLIDAEKEPVSAANPAIKPPDREALPRAYVRTEKGTQIINIAYLILNEQTGGIMERFNCCTCDRCVEAVMELSLKELPQSFVTVKRDEDENEVNRTAAQLRKTAVHVITKAVIAVKSNPKH